MSRSFWNYGHGLCFAPRVKPIARRAGAAFDDPGAVLVRVTGRDQAHKHHFMPAGRRLWVSAAHMYAKRGTVRGSCGRLWYGERMTREEFDSLPEVHRG